MPGSCSQPGTPTATWEFVYDGDGTRVQQVYTEGASTLTTYYFAGGAYEVQDDGSASITKKYYSFAGQAVAMHDGTDLVYFLSDHLGSFSLVVSDEGVELSEQRYLPFGQVRQEVGTISETDFGYTGQRDLPALGLMDYRARFYDPRLGRFIQADTLVPAAANPQGWNRYSYANDNPLYYTDPSGHEAERSSHCERDCEIRFSGDEISIQNCKASCNKSYTIEILTLTMDFISEQTKYWANTPASMRFYVPDVPYRVTIVRTPRLQNQLSSLSKTTAVIGLVLQTAPEQIENQIQKAPLNDRVADLLIDVSIWGVSTVAAAGGATACSESGPLAVACAVAAGSGTSLFLNAKVDQLNLRRKLARFILDTSHYLRKPGPMCYPDRIFIAPKLIHQTLWNPFENPFDSPFDDPFSWSE